MSCTPSSATAQAPARAAGPRSASGRWSPGPAPPRGHDGSGCHRRGDLAAGWRTVAPAVFGWPGGVDYQARSPSRRGDSGEVGAGNGDVVGAGVGLLLLHVESHHLVLVHGVRG